MRIESGGGRGTENAGSCSGPNGEGADNGMLSDLRNALEECSGREVSQC